MRELRRRSHASCIAMRRASTGWTIAARFMEEDPVASRSSAERLPAPVEVAPIERRAITLRRTFSGSLEAKASIVIAPKVGGRLERLGVDLGDSVKRGEIVAWLDANLPVDAIVTNGAGNYATWVHRYFRYKGFRSELAPTCRIEPPWIAIAPSSMTP